MKGRSFQGVLFIFWLLLATISMIWISFTFLIFMELFFIESIFQFVFILSILNLVIAIVSVYEIYNNARQKVFERNKKEKNIKDFYSYQQLLEPPDADMNN